MIVVPRRKLRNVDSRVVSRYGIYRGLHLRGSGLLLGDFPNFWMIRRYDKPINTLSNRD